ATKQRLGGTCPFERGLYASCEMLVDGFLDLYRSGILRRKVYGHVGRQRLLNYGKISEEVGSETLDVLIDAGIISAHLTAEDFSFLQQFGIFKPELNYEAGSIRLDDGTRIFARLSDDDTKKNIA